MAVGARLSVRSLVGTGTAGNGFAAQKTGGMLGCIGILVKIRFGPYVHGVAIEVGVLHQRRNRTERVQARHRGSVLCRCGHAADW